MLHLLYLGFHKIPVAEPPIYNIPQPPPTIYKEIVSHPNDAVPASQHTMEVAKQMVLNNPILLNELSFVKDMPPPPPYAPPPINPVGINENHDPEFIEMENITIINHPPAKGAVHSTPIAVKTPKLHQNKNIIVDNKGTVFCLLSLSLDFTLNRLLLLSSD